MPCVVKNDEYTIQIAHETQIWVPGRRERAPNAESFKFTLWYMVVYATKSFLDFIRISITLSFFANALKITYFCDSKTILVYLSFSFPHSHMSFTMKNDWWDATPRATFSLLWFHGTSRRGKVDHHSDELEDPCMKETSKAKVPKKHVRSH